MHGRALLNLLLLVGVGLLAWWISSDTKPLHERVSTLSVDSVRHISIEPRDGQRLELVHGQQGWRILAPRDLPASAHHLDMLLGFLQQPVLARYPRDQIDLVAAGLSRPALAVEFDGRRYLFGGLDPLQGRRYLLHDDEVLLVQEGVSALLLSPWWNFIDRRLLPVGMPRRLHFSDGTAHTPAEVEYWVAHWQQGAAAIVTPSVDATQGEAFELELSSGERIPWQRLAGERPGLLRPDLGLVYQVNAEQMDALLGRAAAQ